MENTEEVVVVHPWDQRQELDDDDEQLEESLLIARRKNLIYIPLSTTNNGASINITNGQHQQQEKEDETEVLDLINQENGVKVDEVEKEKENPEIPEYSVYFDTDKGIWKCRICPWDNQGRVCLTHHYQHPNGHSHKPVNVKTVFETKDNGSHSELTEEEGNGVTSTAPVKSSAPDNTEITKNPQDNGNGVHHFISNQNGECQNHEISFEEVDKNVPSYLDDKTEISEIQETKDGDDEITEFDVETVLKKQDTHDLFCPNCNSCITKRVILRKRKRRIPVPGEEAKRNKSEVNVVLDDTSNSRDHNGVNTSLGDVQPLTSSEYDDQREPDVFRCLSCFSIFMPTGNGFKLFRMFGNKNNDVNNEHSQKDVPVKKHWLFNFFGSDKMEKNANRLNDSEAVQSLDVKNNMKSSTREVNSSNTDGTTSLEKSQLQSATSSVGRNENVPSSTQGSDITEQRLANESDNATESTGMFSMDEQLLTSYHTESNGQSDYPGLFVVKPPLNNVEPADNSVSPFQHDGLKLVVPPNVGSLIIDNSQMNQDLDVTVHMNNPDDKGRTNLSFSPPASILGQSNLGYQINDLGLPINLAINGKEQNMYKDKDIMPEVSRQHTFQNNVEIYSEERLKVDKDVLTDRQIDLLEDLKNIERIKGKDTIITIESKQPESSPFQSTPDTLGGGGTPALQCPVGQGSVTTATGGRGLDIVKSVVYGGLMELITSLSVVSSAAGTDAATVNVLALGLANILGGLFVISHDLWDLKNERTRKTEDRYQQVLGQRANFPLHMVVALLSYLVFGFLPPLVYGFSFRESNKKDFKLLMVAAVSIVSIMILAAAKAYVQNPHKSYFKTIAYYFMFGFMVSGVSYLFGGLIIRLLEKIDIFHSSSAVNLSIHGAISNPAIATY